MREYCSLGMPRGRALAITGLTSHAYYYKPKPDRRSVGRPPSTVTRVLAADGTTVAELTEPDLREVLRELCADPDLHYGYRAMTEYLTLLGYVINHKKLYRIMDDEGLLHERHRAGGDAAVKRVRHRRFEVEGPLRGLEMDIKFIYVEEHRRDAFALTVIDVFTREVLAHHLAYSITRHDIKAVWTRLIEEHLQPADLLADGIEVQIRNDNDPRFRATMVQEFFRDNQLAQVFTHPYTPQENGHVESFHSILGRSLDGRTFLTLPQLEVWLTGFYEKYNHVRLHGSAAYLPPSVFRQEWDRGNVIVTTDKRQRQRFKLAVPYTGLRQGGSSGNTSQRPLVAT